MVAQAPEHAIENKKLRAKAGGDAKKVRKLKMRQPPERGYAHWDAETFTRLQESPPEPLRSRFRVSTAMILNLFEREDNGCLALRQLIRSSHEGPTSKRNHARHAIALIRSLRDAGVVELNGEGPRVHEDFQSDFSLNQALSLYVVEAVDVLDKDDALYPLDVLTLVEATLEDPWAVLYRQTDTLKGRALAAMKADGMEYDERMAELDKIEYPKPRADLLYATYEVFAEHHRWVGSDVLRPKSIARDMYELGMSFVEYVKEYGLQRSEGVLLRYLTDAYKGFVQTVPESAKTDALYDVSDWLGLTVRSVDASLLDEWEQLQVPGEAPVMPVERDEDETVDITKDERGFTTMARNAAWQIVRFLAFKQYERAAEALFEASGEQRLDRRALRRCARPLLGRIRRHRHRPGRPEQRPSPNRTPANRLAAHADPARPGRAPQLASAFPHRPRREPRGRRSGADARSAGAVAPRFRRAFAGRTARAGRGR